MTLYMVFVMASALAPNIAAQLVFRFLAGFFGATPLVCAGGSLSDVWSPLERVYTFPVFANAGFLGPVLGPVVGGYAASSKVLDNWRWVCSSTQGKWIEAYCLTGRLDHSDLVWCHLCGRRPIPPRDLSANATEMEGRSPTTSDWRRSIQSRVRSAHGAIYEATENSTLSAIPPHSYRAYYWTLCALLDCHIHHPLHFLGRVRGPCFRAADAC